MKIINISPIDWKSSMERLSIDAFFLLNILYRHDISINDKALMSKSGHGLSSHRKYKKELVDTGYLTIEQVGRGIYQYHIGEVNGK